MIPIEGMVDELKNDIIVSALVDERVYDHDLRRAGSGAITAIFDDTGSVRPSIMVDDAGGGRHPGSRSSTVFQDRVYVWVFAPRTRTGRNNLKTLTERIIAIFQQWQDTDTGVLLFYGDRVGIQETDAPNESYMDRVTFNVNGVNRGTTW